LKVGGDEGPRTHSTRGRVSEEFDLAFEDEARVDEIVSVWWDLEGGVELDFVDRQLGELEAPSDLLLHPLLP
jgi:hypothetical protein